MAIQLKRLFVCLSCEGTYRDIDSSGAVYHHACGPMPPAADGVQLERPNKRDETIVMDRQHNVVGIRSEGEGVRCLSNRNMVEPPWLTKLKQTLPKDEDE